MQISWGPGEASDDWLDVIPALDQRVNSSRNPGRMSPRIAAARLQGCRSQARTMGSPLLCIMHLDRRRDLFLVP